MRLPHLVKEELARLFELGLSIAAVRSKFCRAVAKHRYALPSQACARRPRHGHFEEVGKICGDHILTALQVTIYVAANGNHRFTESCPQIS